MHFIEPLLREIAAEGLEGISLNNLWLRLSHEDSEFPWKIADQTKKFIWEKLCFTDCIQFFVYPEPIKIWKPFDRRTWLDHTELGSYYYVPEDYQPLPIHPVIDAVDAGSCRFFRERIDVTCEVRTTTSTFITLEDAIKRWGDHLALVVSLEQRTRYLLGDKCNLSQLTLGCYVILECIAKLRYNGLPTNFEGLLASGVTNTSLWYVRKKMEKLGLIRTQPYIAKFRKSLATGFLLQHWRYHRNFPNPHALVFEKISGYLEKTTNRASTPQQIRKDLALSVVSYRSAASFGSRQNCLEILALPYNEACSVLLGRPFSEGTDADQSLLPFMHSVITGGPNKGMVCVLKLTKPFRQNYSDGPPDGGRKSADGRQFSASDDDADEEEEEEGHDGDAVEEGEEEEEDFENRANYSQSSFPQGVVRAEMGVHTVTDNNIRSRGLPGETIDAQVMPGKPEVQARSSMLSYKWMLAPSPVLNTEFSLVAQTASYLLAREHSMSETGRDLRVEYFIMRRVIRGLETIHAVLVSKRSMKSTFVMWRKLLTTSERLEYLENRQIGGASSSMPTGVNLQTQRIKRREFILDHLAKQRVVRSVARLREVIWAHEKIQGLTMQMDPKSLVRIVNDLVSSKEMVIHTVETIRGDIRLLCHPDVTVDDPLVKEIVRSFEKIKQDSNDRIQGRLFCANTKGSPAYVALSPESMQLVSLKVPYVCRVRRRILLHEFLFYVTYILDSDAIPVIPATEDEPAVYCDDDSWRRFVAPMKTVQGLQRGWFLLTDFFRVLPFGLYLHLISPSRIPRLLYHWLGLPNSLLGLSASQVRWIEADLAGKPHLPLGDLLRYPMEAIVMPGGPRGQLTTWLLSRTRRMQVRRLVEELTLHGLATVLDRPGDGEAAVLAPWAMEEKTTCYLHRHGVLLDTRTAEPSRRILFGLDKCRLLHFHLRTAADVASYWQTCEAVCVHTPLGVKLSKEPVTGIKVPPITLARVVDHLTDDLVASVMAADTGDAGVLLANLNWPEEMLARLSPPPRLADGSVFRPCGACGIHPADFTRHNWREKRTERSKRRDSAVASRLEGLTTDRLPFNDEEYFWPWSLQLFEDSDMHRDLDLHFISQSICEHSNHPRDEPSKNVEITGPMVSLPINSQNQPVSASPPEEDSCDSPDASYLRRKQTRRVAIRLARKLRGEKPRRRRGRNFIGSHCLPLDRGCARSKWTVPEDQLLIVCRIASIIIVGVNEREHMCVPYQHVSDILRRYFPETDDVKDGAAYSRRLRFILFLKGNERLTANLLLTRVSSQMAAYKQYQIGRVEWLNLCRDSPEQSREIFTHLVNSIVSNFMPSLRRIQVRQRIKVATTGEINDILAHAAGSASGMSPSRPIQDWPLALTAAAAGSRDESCHLSTGPDVGTLVHQLPKDIGSSRAEVERRFVFVTCNDSRNSVWVEDVATDRFAVAVFTLYNYYVSAFEMVPEVSWQFNGRAFTRSLRQYPRPQVTQSLQKLMNHRVVLKSKRIPSQNEIRIIDGDRMKLTRRFQQWAVFQFVTRVRHILEMQAQLTLAASQLTGSSSGGDPVKKEAGAAGHDWPIQHRFSQTTTGGCVAYFLQMMMLDTAMEFQMDFSVEDIVVIGNEALQHSLHEYKSNVLQSYWKTIHNSQMQAPSSPVHCAPDDNTVNLLSKRKHVEPLDGSLLHRTKLSKNCFTDAQFWANSKINRRSRWFDHHLSFSGGSIKARHRRQSKIGDFGNKQAPQLQQQPDLLAHWHSSLKATATQVLREVSPTLLLRFTSVSRNEPPVPVGHVDGSDDVHLEGSSLMLAKEMDHFLSSGHFTGRSDREIRTRFGDGGQVSEVLKYLIAKRKAYWFGTSISRFVHWKHIRLWLVHTRVPQRPGAATEESQPPGGASTTIKRAGEADDGVEPAGKRRRLSLDPDITSEGVDTLSQTTTPVLSPTSYTDEVSSVKATTYGITTLKVTTNNWSNSVKTTINDEQRVSPTLVDEVSSVETTTTDDVSSVKATTSDEVSFFKAAAATTTTDQRVSLTPADDALSGSQSARPTKPSSQRLFFYPEWWSSEVGGLKPRTLSSLLQSLAALLVQDCGCLLADFAKEYQAVMGQQAVRRLLLLLEKVGAVKLKRIVSCQKVALFSRAPTYRIIDDVLLAPADEVMLIPSVDCLACVGEFCRQMVSLSELEATMDTA